MGQYTSYWMYQKYETRGEQDPIPVYPNYWSVDADGTLPKITKLENDEECGYRPDAQYRWVNMDITKDYYCDECEAMTRWIKSDETICVEDIDPYLRQYFTIVVNGVGSDPQYPSLQLSGASGTFYYSLDSGNTWTEATSATTIVVGRTPQGFTKKVMFKGNLTRAGVVVDNDRSVSYEAEGNIMSLFYNDNFETATTISSSFACSNMFSGCTLLTSIDNLKLPATSFGGYGWYSSMFCGTSITSIPNNFLPATNLRDYCYLGMFAGCTGLTDCSNLVLPASSVGQRSYSSMFARCTSLIKAPYILATSITNEYACDGMFDGCTQLNEIHCNAERISYEGSYSSTGRWVRNVSSTGTFYKKRGADWGTCGNNTIPCGWTVIEV